MKRPRMYPDIALRHVREWLEWVKWREGDTCPACGQRVKVNVYKFGAAHAKNLIWLYQNAREEFVHVPTAGNRGVLTTNVVGKLVSWGLAERMPNIDDPTKNKTGYYRITKKGVAFLAGGITIPSRMMQYNGETVGFGEEHTTMSEALKRKFNFEELMREQAKA